MSNILSTTGTFESKTLDIFGRNPLYSNSVRYNAIATGGYEGVFDGSSDIEFPTLQTINDGEYIDCYIVVTAMADYSKIVANGISTYFAYRNSTALHFRYNDGTALQVPIPTFVSGDIITRMGIDSDGYAYMIYNGIERKTSTAVPNIGISFQYLMSQGAANHSTGTIQFFDTYFFNNHLINSATGIAATNNGVTFTETTGDANASTLKSIENGYVRVRGNLLCTSAGIASVPSTDAYGVWEFEVNNYTGVYALHFNSDLVTVNNGYRIVLSSDYRVYLQKYTGGSSTVLFRTVPSYVTLGADYQFKVERNSEIDEYVTGGIGTFVVYIKGGVFTDWTLVDPTGGAGTNPVTDNTYITSGYILADLDAASIIKNITINDQYIKPDDFTVQTGAYTITPDADVINVVKNNPSFTLADGDVLVKAGSYNMISGSQLSFDPTVWETYYSYGENTVINGIFDTDTDWSKSSTAITGGVAAFTGVASANIRQASVFGVAKKTRVLVTISGYTTGTIKIAEAGGLTLHTITSPENKAYEIEVTTVDGGNIWFLTNDGFVGNLDNVIVQEITEHKDSPNRGSNLVVNDALTNLDRWLTYGTNTEILTTKGIKFTNVDTNTLTYTYLRSTSNPLLLTEDIQIGDTFVIQLNVTAIGTTNYFNIYKTNDTTNQSLAAGDNKITIVRTITSLTPHFQFTNLVVGESVEVTSIKIYKLETSNEIGHLPHSFFNLLAYDSNPYAMAERFSADIVPYIDYTDVYKWSPEFIEFMIANPDTVNADWRGHLYFKCKDGKREPVFYPNAMTSSQQDELRDAGYCMYYSGLATTLTTDSGIPLTTDSGLILVTG